MNFMSFQGPTFMMQVPTNWFVTSTPSFQAMFVAPPGENELRANLAVSLTLVKESVTLEKLTKAAKDTQQKEYSDYQVIREGASSEYTVKGFERLYKWHNLEKGMRVVQRQFFCLVGQTLYTITATREDREEAESLEQVFEKIIASFEVGERLR